MTIDWNGDLVLRVDKPVGPTSHDVIASARRALHTRRIGHTGTLDPFASGLLLLCVNRATRVAEFLTRLDKAYTAVARLDAFTTTDDGTGEPFGQTETWRDLDADRVVSAMHSLTGQISQVPPAYSAKKIQGERAYRRARRGEVPATVAARVQVARFELLELNLPELSFMVECSSGTYVRALARDLGRTLGTGGYLKELRRTRIGDMTVVDAVPMDALHDAAARERAVLSPLQALAHLPTIELDQRSAQRFGQGQPLPRPTPEPRAVIAVKHQETLLAVAREDGEWLWPVKVLSAARE
jgi:tRNA pseudouridine55 synthase